MRIDNSGYYRRQKRSVRLRLILALLIIVAVAAAYFVIDRQIAVKTRENLINEDYSSRIITFEKSGNENRAGYSLYQQQPETLGTYEYVTPLGFSIISESEKWTGKKLKEVYNELLNNEHGDEIMYISKIIIYPGASDIGLTDSNVAGTHSQERSEYRVFFDLPAFLPQSMEYVMKSSLSVIELYNMDAYDDISQAACTISHEYGHHYTMFYFLQNDEAAKDSKYYQLRSLDHYDHEVFFDTIDEYYQNHEWSIYEIAAEDYVQLMGSGTGKKTEEFLDVYDLLNEHRGETPTEIYNESIVNIYPQENIEIPLADETAGLRDYFYSFIGAENDLEPLESVNINISLNKKSALGYPYYELTWNKTSKDPDALYTLMCYDMEGNIVSAIRTVHGDEKAVARVGNYTIFDGIHNITVNQKGGDITAEDRYFKVIVLLPDGRMQSSKLFYVDF